MPRPKPVPLHSLLLDQEAAALGQRVGENLRRRRKGLRMSLGELAATTGVSRAALSQIESYRGNPTVAVLWKLAAGLGLSFTELVGERPEAVQVLRRTDTEPRRSADGKLERRPLVLAGPTDGLEIEELRLAAQATHISQPRPSGTREVVLVLEGRLRLRTTDAGYDLSAGDSIIIDANRSHVFENPGPGEGCYEDLVLYEKP